MNKNKKKWGFEIRTHKKFIQDRIEFDYLAKLNCDESKWLEAFNLAVAEGKYNELENLGVDLSKKLKKELNRDRYLADLCSGPKNAQVKQQNFRKNLTRKMNLAKEILSDLEGIDLEVALAECRDVFTSNRKAKQ